MSCNDDFFVTQEQVIKGTWIKKIDQFDNIDYIIYRGDPNIQKHKYDKQEHLLTLKCEDDVNNSFKKTYYAFNLAHKIFNYDYIFRTNCSTWVNIQLLRHFIDGIPEEDSHFIYSSSICFLNSRYSFNFKASCFNFNNSSYFSA